MPPLALRGVVTKAGVMNKTVTVTVTRSVEHPLAHKMIARSKKYLTHDPKNELKLGDECLIRNCPPVSARKRFALEKIFRRAPTITSEAESTPASAPPSSS